MSSQLEMVTEGAPPEIGAYVWRGNQVIGIVTAIIELHMSDDFYWRVRLGSDRHRYIKLVKGVWKIRKPPEI
jgi:hypothetical protein